MSLTTSSMSPAGGRPILTQTDLQNHQVGTGGQDIIWAPLYDSNAWPSAGVASGGLLFFAAQKGQGTSSAPGAGAVAKTIFDTNLTLGGQLGMGNDFYVIGVEMPVYPGVTNSTSTPFGLYPGIGAQAPANTGFFVNDLWNILCQGFITFAVGTDRNFVQDGPLINFPPTVGLDIACALAEIGPSSTSTGVGNAIVYGRGAGEPYTIVPVYLQATQQFTFVVTTAAVVALPSTIAARIQARLRGYLIRQVT
jgi:hypothetical protein